MRALFVLAALGAVACSSNSDRPAAASSLLDAGAHDAASSSDDGGTTDPDAAGSITPRPDLCMGLTLGGAATEEMAYATDPIAPIGGDVVAGTYDLTEADTYTGSADAGDSVTMLTGRTIQSTIIVTDFELRMLTAIGNTNDDSGAAAPTAQAFLYRTADTSILGTLVCPSTANPTSMGYSTSGTGLAIYPDATRRWLYTLRD